MTSRVNVKFVAIMGGVLLTLCAGVAAVGVTMLRKTPEQHARLGDELAAAGKWKEAAERYSRAVHKDPNDPRWLRLWIGALEHITPETSQEYMDMYFRSYLPALRALADAEKGKPEPAVAFLEEVWTRIARVSPSLRGWEELAALTEDMLRPYAGNPQKAVGIARYRALARVGIYGLGTDLTREVYDQTLADLTAALEANPADASVAVALTDLYRTRAYRLREELADDEKADQTLALAKQTLSEFVERNPGSVHARYALLRLSMSEMVRQASRPMTFAALVEAHRQQIDELLAAARNAEPGSTPPGVLAMTAALVRSVPDLGHETALEILDREIASGKNDTLLMVERAELLHAAGKTDEALAQLQKVIDTPDRPLSLQGLLLLDLRTRAAARQVDFALSRWRADLPARERAAILEEAGRYRAAFAARVGPDRPELLLMDAKLKYTAGELDAARTLLTRYNEVRGEGDHTALVLLGDIMSRQNNPGAARRQYELAARLRPTDTRVLLALAGTELQLRDYAAAAARLRRILEIEPDHPTAGEQLRIVSELQKGEKSTDPIVRALNAVQDLTSGVNPDLPAAIEVLRKAISENGQDPRLVRPLVQMLGATGDLAGAQAAVREGLAANPDDKALQQLDRLTRIEDPVQFQLDSINSSDAPEFVKHIRRYEVYTATGQADKAAAELAAARALDPEAPRLLEIDFVSAAAAGRIDEARSIAEKAAARNADNVGGLTYRARVALLENRAADAASFLQQAVDADPLNPLIWRLLGDTRRILQQGDRAADAYTKALEIRPGDPAAVKGLILAQVMMGRLSDALAVARREAENNARDPEFVDLWVRLESSAVNGDRAKAIEVRRQLMQRNPDDRANRTALADLLVAARQFSEARTLIDALRAEADSPILVELDARWHAAQGDLSKATLIFGQYIDSIPAEQRTDTPYILLAQLLSNHNFPEQAIRVLEEGRKYQDPKLMRVDRELAELYGRFGRVDKTLEVIQRMLAAGVQDEGDRLLRASVECLLQLGRFDEAETTLAGLGQKADSDAGFVLLRAQAARGRGEMRRARDLFDRAVTLENENPRCYFARAQFLASDPVLAHDAEADLLQAIRLAPSWVEPRRLLASIHANAGRWDDAFNVFRDAVAANPDDDALRRSYISALQNRGRHAEAIAQLNEALSRKPDSTYWLQTSSEVYTIAGSADQALPHLERLWDLAKTKEAAVAYVTALAVARPPRLERAFEVLRTPELKTESSMELLILRSLVHSRAGNTRAVLADIEAAYRLLNHADATQVTNFFSGLNGLPITPAERLQLLSSLRNVAPFTKWVAFHDVALRAQLPDAPATVADEFRPLAEQNEDAPLSLAARRAMGDLYTLHGRFEEAAEVYRRGVDINPEDPNFNNGYAYVVGCRLGRPAEALPYAEKAARLLPQNASVLHTLGAVQLALGKLNDAEATLVRAQATAQRPHEKAPVLLAMARLKLAQNNRPDCSRYLSLVQEIFGANPDLKNRYGAEADEVKKALDAG